MNEKVLGKQVKVANFIYANEILSSLEAETEPCPIRPASEVLVLLGKDH